jgi:hypothetical protein
MFVCFTFVSSVVNLIYSKQLVLLYEFVAVKTAARNEVLLKNTSLKVCLLIISARLKQNNIM